MDYQLVLYDDNKTIIDVTKPITNVEVDGNFVKWSGGMAQGINTNFIVIPIDITVGDPGETLDQDVIDRDEKQNLLSKEKNLEEQIKALQEALNFLLGL